MSRLIDARGRLFGKVNVVDILVLAVIVALAVFLGLRFGGDDSVGKVETQPVTLTFVVQPAYDGMIQAYTELGELKDNSGRRIGDIERAEAGERNQVEVSGRDWEFVLDFAAPSRVILEVSAQGTISGDTVRVGSLAARVGAVVQLVGPGWEGEARIMRVEIGASDSE